MKLSSIIRHKCHNDRYSKVKDLISHNPGFLLDIGCGRPCEDMADGSFIKYIGYGVGIDTKHIHSDFDFIIADARNLPFKKNTFDIIVAMEVIEHVDRIDQFLIEIRDSLKPNGLLVLSTPVSSLYWGIIWFFWTNTAGKMWKDTHKNNFTKKEWIKKIEKHFILEGIKLNWFHDLILTAKPIIK